MKVYNKNNFHKHTFCIFNEVNSLEIGELDTHFVSKSGSSYYFTEKGVYRKSNHWGRAANCKWRLQTFFENSSRTKIGYAEWSHFYAINETEKLYYIEVNFEKKTVQYYHKCCSGETNLFLRTASATTKRVKEIRTLFDNDKKLRFWDNAYNLEQLLKIVIDTLVTTDLTLLQIKLNLQK
jgi:hypothetical protein